jgi:hypothetical protein
LQASLLLSPARRGAFLKALGTPSGGRRLRHLPQRLPLSVQLAHQRDDFRNLLSVWGSARCHDHLPTLRSRAAVSLATRLAFSNLKHGGEAGGAYRWDQHRSRPRRRTRPRARSRRAWRMHGPLPAGGGRCLCWLRRSPRSWSAGRKSQEFLLCGLGEVK